MMISTHFICLYPYFGSFYALFTRSTSPPGSTILHCVLLHSKTADNMMIGIKKVVTRKKFKTAFCNLTKKLLLLNFVNIQFWTEILHKGTFINDVPYQGRQGGPRQPKKGTLQSRTRQVGRSKMAKKRGTSLMNVPLDEYSKYVFIPTQYIYLSMHWIVLPQGTFIDDVPRFLAIFDLPTYLPCPTL